MSVAAWSTPFLTTDQNGSEACPWVTTAIRMSLRATFPWAPEPPLSSCPLQLTAANSATASPTASTHSRLLVLFIYPHLRSVFPPETPSSCLRPPPAPLPPSAPTPPPCPAPAHTIPSTLLLRAPSAAARCPRPPRPEA